MLKKLENQEKTTVMKIQEQYPDNWFRYGVTENGYVYAVFVADTYAELLTVSDEEMESLGFFNWGNGRPYNLVKDIEIQMGGAVLGEWQD